jgi:hypothetical protein
VVPSGWSRPTPCSGSCGARGAGDCSQRGRNA